MEEKICFFSEESLNLKCLNAYVENINLQNICSELNSICLKKNGSTILQIFFKKLSNSKSCQNIRAEVFEKVLSIIQNKLIPPSLAKKLIFTLSYEIESLSTVQLVSVINKCLLDIQLKPCHNEDDDYCYKWWVELMPQLLATVEERSLVEYNGTNISGAEYKNHVIHIILSSHWEKNTASNLACMFKDMTLCPEDHLMITNQICKHIKNSKLVEIPSLVYQLLQLTKKQNNIKLFTALNEFFNDNLYSQFDQKENKLDSQIFSKDVQIIEKTILHHIYVDTTISNPKSMKVFIKHLKDCLNNPSYILSPFFIMLLLNISEISLSFEEDALNLFTSAISRSLTEENMIFKSTWLKVIIPAVVDINILFKKIIQNCAQSCRDGEKIIKGLLNLGFSLLNLKSKSKEAKNEFAWAAGTTILLILIEKHPQVTKNVLEFLVNQIFQENDSTRYTDCLTKMANKRPLNLLDNTAIIMQLLANVCGKFFSVVGQKVLMAILPLTKLSPSFRDNLIIFLRKALLSNDYFCKEMAVFGFLELLKYLKIEDMKSLSQIGSQNYVGITQIYSGTFATMSGAISNEGMCLEILTILKRIDEFDYNAKLLLYKDIYDTFYANPKLGVQILENLKNRIDFFYKGVGEIPPLDFNKVVTRQITSIDIKVEPIGHLLLGMASIVAKTELNNSEKNKFKELLDSIGDGMLASDISHFDLKKDNFDVTNNYDIKNEFQQAKIEQIIKVYEALIGYILCTWTAQSLQHACKLNQLFKKFLLFWNYERNAMKPIKQKAKKKKNGSKKENKIWNFGKLKTKFKFCSFPNTILNFKCVYRLLVVLYGANVDWATQKNTELLRNKIDLHKYAFHVLLNLISDKYFSQKKIVKNKNILQYVFRIGKILNTECLAHLSKLKSFDLQCSLLAMNCFKELLNLISIHFNKKISVFFKEIGLPGNDIVVQLKNILDIVFAQVLDLLKEMEDELEKKDILLCEKLSLILLRIGSLLVEYLPRNTLCAQEVFATVKSICKEKKIKNPYIAKELLYLLVNTSATAKICNGVTFNIVFCLCKIMTLLDHELEVTIHENFKVINTETANHCLLFICGIIRQINGEIEWVLDRCKAEGKTLSFAITQSSQAKNEIEEKENEICRRLNLNIKILSVICTMAIPPGLLADAVLKEVGNLYNKLVLIVKYFLQKFSKSHETIISTRFKKMIKMADQELTKNMYCFTEHIIANGSASTEDFTIKKQRIDVIALKNKVLKETKIIPRVIYEKEQFQKYVLLLSNKTKIDLELRNSMVRDYRLYARQVKDVIEKENLHKEKILSDAEDNSESAENQMPKRLRIQ